MAFSLGSIDPLNVGSWDGFDYPSRSTVVAILGDGASTQNAVIQGSGPTLRQARIAGTLTDGTDVATLRGFYEDVTDTTFEDDDGTSHPVVVQALSIRRIFVDVWQYDATLVQTDEPTPGP